MEQIMNYVKPELIFEDFQLSHTVANCSPAMNHSKENCDYDSSELPGLIDSGTTVFNADQCTLSFDDFSKIYENYCIQTGSEIYNLFTS